jgi:hypothetical protein
MPRRRGKCKSERKQFFFEKKNQKTFANAANIRFKRVNSVLPAIDKSFLVLFFKKELLPFFGLGHV